MRKIVLLSSIIICTLATVLFILKANDHAECKEIVETSFSEDGKTKIRETKHICNEKFNL